MGVNLVKELCNRFRVIYNSQFEDPAVPDVHFDPALGFLGYCGHQVVAYLNTQGCCDGPRRLVHQTIDAMARQRKRSCKKCVKFPAVEELNQKLNQKLNLA